jgi:predicted metal-dependent hydrolase
MQQLKYIAHYSEHTKEQVRRLIDDGNLGKHLLKKYPRTHSITTDKALYDYTMRLKNDSMRKSQPLAKVVYDGKLSELHAALGLHTFSSRVQGGKLKSKSEIRIASTFKTAPDEFLRMIVVHELAHLKEKQHNKAFYALCTNIEPSYHQFEFDVRLYLTHLYLFGELYDKTPDAPTRS